VGLVWCAGAFAATARDGFQPQLSDLASVPSHRVTPVAPSPPRPGAKAPVPFATGAEAPLDLSDGLWTNIDGETAVWRLRVAWQGARMLSASLVQFEAPPDARLYLYDPNSAVVQGPFGASRTSSTTGLSLPFVPGDEALLELRLPSAERGQVRLRLGRVYRAREWLSIDPSPRLRTSPLSGETAAGCETNVACPAGDGWRDPIRAAALIQVGNGSDLELCSGELVNNVREDGTPYLLTAHHCGIGTGSFPASSVVVYWNFQADTCTGTSGSLADTQTGSILVSTDAGSDFALIQLNEVPAAAYGVFYAGWDASTAIAQSGVGIHHPVADIKKISTFTSPVSRQTIAITDIGDGTQTSVAAWEVGWTSGIMEEGSSGSGLWNQDGHLVGVLSGGDSRCSTGVSSTGNDYFGRLEVAWQAHAAADGQLKAWLDPDNSGTLVLDGQDAITTASGTTTGSGGAAAAVSKAGSATPFGLLLLAIAPALRRNLARRARFQVPATGLLRPPMRSSHR